MDPDANFRERIALARTALGPGGWSHEDHARYDELTSAYAEWRAAGGFLADYALRQTLLALDARIRKASR